MDFLEMVGNLKKCQKTIGTIEKFDTARRPSWKKGEHLWSNGQFLVHNTPYFASNEDEALINVDEYVYVCELEDIIAKDWEVCENRKNMGDAK